MVESATRAVRQRLSERQSEGGSAAVKIGIHTHNDCGLAVANTITAVHSRRRNGARHHQRLRRAVRQCRPDPIIPILSLKMNRPCMSPENLVELKTLSRFVSETANLVPLNTRPFVGRSAFAHKGGIHVSAIMKEPRAYEHMDPETVGNQRRVLMSDLAGKSNVEYKAKEMGVDLDANGSDSKAIVAAIKQMEDEGYQFDVADGSFKILVRKIHRTVQAACSIWNPSG